MEWLLTVLLGLWISESANSLWYDDGEAEPNFLPPCPRLWKLSDEAEDDVERVGEDGVFRRVNVLVLVEGGGGFILLMVVSEIGFPSRAVDRVWRAPSSWITLRVLR